MTEHSTADAGALGDGSRNFVLYGHFNKVRAVLERNREPKPRAESKAQENVNGPHELSVSDDNDEIQRTLEQMAEENKDTLNQINQLLAPRQPHKTMTNFSGMHKDMIKSSTLQ